MASKFVFGGRSSEDFSLRIERFPQQTGAARRRETIPIAGRNGALHISEDAFDNFTLSYKCYFHGDRPTPAMTHAIREWLQGSGEYLRLEDTYDPDIYRMATFAGPLDVENIFNRFGRCTINFDCAPQAFLKSGENTLVFTQPGTLFNPTVFKAKPLIRVCGTDAGTVTVGSATVQIHSITDRIILDCDMEDAYRQAGEGDPKNWNGNIYAPDFPVLLPGENTVSFTGGITQLEIIPRWWRL